MRRKWIGQALVAVLLATGLVVVVYRTVARNDEHASLPSGVGSRRHVTIPADGASLAAEVLTPARRHGRAPLVIMPASWGSSAEEYHAIAAGFASSGYLVVAYAQRGFAPSTGSVDLAGAATQADVSTVIDWALAHEPADAKRVGAFGISYGAGVSLLAAARDRRIRAVAALSTWADLGQAFDVNRTPATAALTTLIDGVKGKAAFGPEIQHLQSVLESRPKDVGPAIQALSAARSPARQVAALNRNKAAIMIANGFEDSIFPPYQLVSFFQSLSTPKRLELAAGDHGGPEARALAGHDDQTVDDAQAWLDHYLRGAANAVSREAPIVLHDVRTGATRSYQRWPKAGAQNRYALPKPDTADGSASATGWSATLRAGSDSGASSSPPQNLSTTAYQSPTAIINALNHRAAFIWSGPRLTTDLVLSGTVQLHLLLSATAPAVSLFLHLYDVDAKGVGRLVTSTAYTTSRLKPTRPTGVTVALQPIAWTVPTGHHVAVVLDTVDPRYTTMTPPGTKVTVSSSVYDPAALLVAPGQ